MTSYGPVVYNFLCICVVVELFPEITTQQGMYKHSGEEHSMVQIDYVHPHYHVVPVLQWE